LHDLSPIFPKNIFDRLFKLPAKPDKTKKDAAFARGTNSGVLASQNFYLSLSNLQAPPCQVN